MNTAVLVKTFIYVMLLVIGYTGKRAGLFGRENSKFLNNVICFLTMPAAVINGFQGVGNHPFSAGRSGNWPVYQHPAARAGPGGFPKENAG